MTDRSAKLESLIETEQPKLARYLRTKVPHSDILDIVQATLLAFVEQGDRRIENERAFLWAIARKLVLKYYEKHRHATTPFDSTVHGVADLGPSLSSRLDKRSQLIAALRTLPSDVQDAFQLRHGEELTLEEVATALDVSLATVKRYLTTAERHLCEKLSEDPDAIGARYRSL